MLCRALKGKKMSFSNVQIHETPTFSDAVREPGKNNNNMVKQEMNRSLCPSPSPTAPLIQWHLDKPVFLCKWDTVFQYLVSVSVKDQNWHH